MKTIRQATRLGYKHVAKPLLFKQHPDDVHHSLVRTAKVVQKVPVIRELPRLWGYRSPFLEQTVLGLRFMNPVGLSAGFNKNIDMASVMRNVGFGFMVGGSVTAEACDGNPKPWFHRLPKSHSLVVYAGLPNQGVERIAQRLTTYPAHTFDNFPLVVSVAKTNSVAAATDKEAILDYCASLKRLDRDGVAPFYEINISCPNTHGGEPFSTPERLEMLLAAIDGLVIHRPVSIKMPIDKPWPEFRALLEVIVKHNVQAVTIGNLRKERKGMKLADSLPNEVKGNLSGAPTREISTRLIHDTYKHYGDKLIVIGVGGIFTAQDAYDKIRAGASLVALITGMIFEGPQVVGDINAGLVALLKRDGYANIAQAIGADVK